MHTTFLAAASVGAIVLLLHGAAAKAAEVTVIAGGPLSAVFNEP